MDGVRLLCEVRQKSLIDQIRATSQKSQCLEIRSMVSFLKRKLKRREKNIKTKRIKGTVLRCRVTYKTFVLIN